MKGFGNFSVKHFANDFQTIFHFVRIFGEWEKVEQNTPENPSLPIPTVLTENNNAF